MAVRLVGGGVFIRGVFIKVNTVDIYNMYIYNYGARAYEFVKRSCVKE